MTLTATPTGARLRHPRGVPEVHPATGGVPDVRWLWARRRRCADADPGQYAAVARPGPRPGDTVIVRSSLLSGERCMLPQVSYTQRAYPRARHCEGHFRYGTDLVWGSLRLCEILTPFMCK